MCFFNFKTFHTVKLSNLNEISNRTEPNLIELITILSRRTLYTNFSDFLIIFVFFFKRSLVRFNRIDQLNASYSVRSNRNELFTKNTRIIKRFNSVRQTLNFRYSFTVYLNNNSIWINRNRNSSEKNSKQKCVKLSKL